jgi:hypothetical protein
MILRRLVETLDKCDVLLIQTQYTSQLLGLAIISLLSYEFVSD